MTTTTKLKPATFKHIEAELYAYHETKKEIVRLREEIMHNTQVDENVGQGKNSYRTPSRPTEIIATRLTTDKRLRNLEEIVDAIEKTYEQVDENHKKMIRLAYWSNKQYTWQRVAEECYVHPNTMTKMRRKVVYLVADHIGWT